MRSPDSGSCRDCGHDVDPAATHCARCGAAAPTIAAPTIAAPPSPSPAGGDPDRTVVRQAGAADFDPTRAREAASGSPQEGPTVPSARQGGAAAAEPGANGRSDGDLYEEIRPIGSGGMGTVVLVRDRRNDRTLCLKRPQIDSDGLVQRFLTEIEVLANNGCKDIVECINFGRDARGPFLVMPYYRKGSLAQRVKDRGKLEEKALVDLAQAMGRALCHLHDQRIMHRDIKPANILISDDEQPVLADFGIVRVAAGSGTMKGPHGPGTKGYMAPELDAGGEASPVTDIYALGQTLRFAATKNPPGSGSDADIAPLLRPVILKCVHREPSQRYQTAREFLRAVEATLSGLASPSALRCPNPECRKPVTRKAQHCASCGHPLFVDCPCEAPLRIGDRHCETCGIKDEDIQKAKDLRKDGIRLLAEGAFEKLHVLTTDIASLHMSVVRYSDELRQRSAEIEPRFHALFRRAQLAESSDGPGAAAALWRQILAICPANQAASERLRTLDVRMRRFTFDQLRKDAEHSLAAGELNEAARLLGELRDSATEREEGVLAKLGKQLAAAEQELRELAARAIDGFIVAGNLQAAEAALRKSIDSGLDADRTASFAARIRAGHRAAWRRDLTLGTGIVVVLALCFVGFLTLRQRSDVAEGVAYFEDGSFKDARDCLDKAMLANLLGDVSWTPRKPALEALDRLLGANVRSWNDADAAALQSAAEATRPHAGLSAITRLADEAARKRLKDDAERLLILTPRGLVGRDGKPLATGVDTWSYELIDNASPDPASAPITIRCRRLGCAPIDVAASLRRKNEPPTLQWLPAAAGSLAATIDAGEKREFTFRVAEQGRRSDDPPPTAPTVSTEPADLVRFGDPIPLSGGDWKIIATGIKEGGATIKVTASDFCGNASQPLLATLNVTEKRNGREPDGPKTPPEKPQLLKRLAPRTNSRRLRIEASASGAKCVEVRLADDASRKLATLREDPANSGVFRGDVELDNREGEHRLVLRASNANGDSDTQLPLVVADFTKPRITSQPDTVEVGEQPLVVTSESVMTAEEVDPNRPQPKPCAIDATGTRIELAPAGGDGRLKRSIQLRLVDLAGNESAETIDLRVRLRTELRPRQATGERQGVVRDAAVCLTASDGGFSLLVPTSASAGSMPCGDLRKPVLVVSTSVSSFATLHESGEIAAWSSQPVLRPLSVPRPALRTNERALAATRRPGANQVVYVVTESGAFDVDYQSGKRTERRAPASAPTQLDHLITAGDFYVARQRDGRVTYALAPAEKGWSEPVFPALGATTERAVQLAKSSGRGELLVGCESGKVLRGTLSAKQALWTGLLDLSDPISALSCAENGAQAAVATKTGLLRIVFNLADPSAGSLDVPLYDGGYVTSLFGPTAVDKDCWQIVYATSAGQVVSVRYQ
jgi:serine/threonine protein kinase/tetratricopeptide (TPR) repeat protein